MFTEFPSNPLLKCHDLRRLSRLAHEFGFLLVVDDTVGNFANTDLLHSQGLRVDVVCSSLTKIFNGRGDWYVCFVACVTRDLSFTTSLCNQSITFSCYFLNLSFLPLIMCNSSSSDTSIPNLPLSSAVSQAASSSIRTHI